MLVKMYINAHYICAMCRNSKSVAKKVAIFSMNQGDFTEVYHGPFCKRDRHMMNMPRQNTRIYHSFLEKQSSHAGLYTYIRFLFSVLVSCDYYATSEYDNGIQMSAFGTIENTEFVTQYEQSERVKQIRRLNPESCVDDKKDINILRNRMFYEAEQTLLENKDANVAFAEAPTGAGVLVPIKSQKNNIYVTIYINYNFINERFPKSVFL